MKPLPPVSVRLRGPLLALIFLLAAGSILSADREGSESPLPLRLEKGARIAILGNALADRMQHAAYLESFIQADHPDHELAFRNLAAAGDEVDTWFRSDNFGSRTDWLSRVGADVIFAFYGFNESQKGEAGLDAFKRSLETFIRDIRAGNFSGRGSPRLVLFSPIANEDHPDRNIPDPAENNRNIAAYTGAMKEVAAANGVAFVDLLGPSREIFTRGAAEGKSLTVNGLYLKDEGYRLLAPKIYEALFGRPPRLVRAGGLGRTERPSPNLLSLRHAVLEKNWQWHQRYRTIDGHNVYGERSALAYLPGEKGFIYDRDPPEPRISNYQVMQREQLQREVMTAARDRRIWAVARGGDLKPDDSEVPPALEVPTNKPGPGGDGEHLILSGEEALEKMTLYPGLKVNLFADEEKFPELVNPVQIAWDTRGRLWVAVWPNYPGRTPTSEQGDSLLVFEDTSGDGQADSMTTYATDLNAPTGFQFYKDGVLVTQAPDLWHLRDTNGDGKADTKERVLMGLDSADSHHTANSLAYDPGGAIYLSDGIFHRSQVETFYGPVRNRDGAIYRFEPRTGRFETYISYNFANPHGRVFDHWGNDLVTDATGNDTYFGPALSGRLDFEHGKHVRMKTFWQRPSRPAAGTALLTSRHFPEDLQGNFLNLNVISFQGIFNVAVQEEGSGLKGETREPLLESDDPNFIPSDIKIGPDGALYFSDWHNPIVGHMQHHLRDPSRDNRHGRIYRITHEERPLLSQPRIHGAGVPELLDLLLEPEDHVRQLAKIELANHHSDLVIDAVNDWIKNLNTDDPEHEHQMMEALWVHQWHNVVDVDLLDRMLGSPEPRARAAAGKVLCYWRDRVPDALGRFISLAGDEDARVRLEAVRGASFFAEARAAEVVLAALEKPLDYYLTYCLTETIRQLDAFMTDPTRDALAARMAPAAPEAAPPDEPVERPPVSFVIRAVRGEMRFDTTRIVVEPGQPFSLVFENADFMPHNLVVVHPGARATIGEIAGQMRHDEVDTEGRPFVPERPEVIAATSLLEMGQSQILVITAPDKEGTYEYVCTFPGHWQVMWGELIVTRDVRAAAEQEGRGSAIGESPAPGPAEAGQRERPHVVFVTGDEEYRSEESMPMLARILRNRHGFKVTVLYAVGDDGAIDPNRLDNIPGLEVLREADLMVMQTRFRRLPDDQLRHIVEFAESGKPMAGFRTATHAFQYGEASAHQAMDHEWPRKVFGQRWIRHHGADSSTEVQRIEERAEHPILRGVRHFHARSWLYVSLPLHPNADPLLIGRAIKGAGGGGDPFGEPQPVAWAHRYEGKGGTSRVFFTTLGHPEDFFDESMRKLAINGIFWALGFEDEIPDEGLEVKFVGEYAPNDAGFGEKYKKGRRPRDIPLTLD